MVIIKAHEGVINRGGTSSGQNMAGGIWRGPSGNCGYHRLIGNY